MHRAKPRRWCQLALSRLLPPRHPLCPQSVPMIGENISATSAQLLSDSREHRRLTAYLKVELYRHR